MMYELLEVGDKVCTWECCKCKKRFIESASKIPDCECRIDKNFLPEQPNKIELKEGLIDG